MAPDFSKCTTFSVVFMTLNCDLQRAFNTYQFSFASLFCTHPSPYRQPCKVDIFLSLLQIKTEAKAVFKTCFKDIGLKMGHQDFESSLSGSQSPTVSHTT